MDNISRFYKSRYETAEQYARNGERQKCMDICWELRLAPDLSLYRRACVNLLIASVVVIRTHPDCAKFAHECIALVDQIRREFELSQETEEELTHLETHARTTLAAIREMQTELQAAEIEAEDPLEGFEETPFSDEDRQAVAEALGIPGEDNEVLEEIDNPDKPWTIEGMYTEYGYGDGRTAPQPEGDQQGQPGDNTKVSGGIKLDVGADTAMSDAIQQNRAVEGLRSSTPTILGDLPFRPRARGYSERTSPAARDDEV